MPQQPDAFRDFGVLPQVLQPPAEKVRCFFSKGRVIGQYIGSGLLSALGVGLAVLLVLTMPLPLNLLGCAGALAGFGSLVYLGTHNDYRWVELDGNTLRAKHLYTGRVIERSLEEIASLATMVYQLRRIETVVIEGILGRVKGVEIRFRDRRTPLRILRADPAMTNAKELIEALLFRMGQIREVDAEVVNHAGQPLVRSIHWKGEKPTAQPGNSLKLCLCCFSLLALMFGPVLGFWGLQEQHRHLMGSVPPQEIALQALIENGPGTNRHIVLTHFQSGGYAIETKSGSWTGVWVALFPSRKTSQRPAEQPEVRKEIKAVLYSKSVPNEAALKRLLQHGSVTGLCSEAPRSSWGMTLGPNLIKANQGLELSSAWLIDELQEPPSAALVQGIFLGSATCYTPVITVAIVTLKLV